MGRAPLSPNREGDEMGVFWHLGSSSPSFPCPQDYGFQQIRLRRAQTSSAKQMLTDIRANE